MTDSEIIYDMDRCLKDKCTDCSRWDEEADCEFLSGCQRTLMHDAYQAMRLQAMSLDGVSDTINKLKEENLALRNALKCNYEKKQLVEKMNDVIRAFGEDGYWDEDCRESPLDLQVDAIKKLLDLIGWDNYKIVIEKGCKYPQILK